MASVKWSDHAMIRMREQTRYVAEQSGSAEIAWKWATDVFSAADDLVMFPELGRPLPELPNTPYLEIIVRRFYRVIYRIFDETCFIVTVRRTSMLIDETTLAEFNSVTF